MGITNKRLLSHLRSMFNADWLIKTIIKLFSLGFQNWVININFSLQNQYINKQASEENKQNHQGDIILLYHQILRTKFQKKYSKQWGDLIFQSKHCSYQIFNGFQKFLFGWFNSFFLSNDCNQLLVFITRCWEYNSCTCIFTHFLDVHPSSANQETMMLWLRTNLKSVTVSLLWDTKKNVL